MIVFRTDASVNSGFQLLARSIYLASLLKKDADILFCIDRDKAAAKILKEKKLPFCRPKDIFKNPVKSILFYVENFLPVDRETTIRAKETDIETVHIALPGMPGSETGCDHRLSGPAFAVLHNRFRHFHQVKRKYRKKVRNLLISLEEAVEYRELRKIIDFLSRYRFNLKIVPAYWFKKSHKKILKRIYPGIHFSGQIDSLARPFFEADAVLINPGTAAYEAAAVGTPALYLCRGKDRESAAKSFVDQQIGVEISKIEDIPEQIARLSLDRRIEMGRSGKGLVDAKGVYRIIDFFKERGII